MGACRRQVPLLVLAAAGLIAGCGPAASRAATGPTPSSTAAAATPAPSTSTPPSTAGPAAPTPAPLLTGLPIPAAGESWVAFWRRRGVSPPPPTNLLDRYAALPLPAVHDGTARTVVAADYARGALRQLAGEQFALAQLRTDLVDAAVLGVPGLSGDAGSIATAKQAGLASVSSELIQVKAASVIAVPADLRKATGQPYLVLLRVQFGPVTGRYLDGSSKALPAGKPVTYALVGHLVRARLLGSFFYVQAAYDCAGAAKGGAIARACATV